MRHFYGTGILILCMTTHLLTASPEKISGWIHRGNGEVFPGELAYTGKRIVSVRKVNVDNIDTTLHITPLMIDLNFYPCADQNKIDSLMISRGMGIFLMHRSPFIILKTVRNLQMADTLGILISVPQKCYDALSSGTADSGSQQMKSFMNKDRRLWWKNIPGMWIPDFNELTQKYNYENVWIVRENTLMKDMVFGNIRMIISYDELKEYEAGKPAESDWFETLGNTGLRFPSDWSYNMADTIFEKHDLPREIFLQLVSVLPAEFLGIDARFGLLVPGYSASFNVFYIPNADSRQLELKNLVVEGVHVR